jgi:hypothetical protein
MLADNRDISDEGNDLSASEHKKEKVYYLDLLTTQFRRLEGIGFVGPAATELLTQNESPLLDLDLNTLKAIARGAELLLRAENCRPTGPQNR